MNIVEVTIIALIAASSKELMSWLVERAKAKQVGSKVKSGFVTMFRNNLLNVCIDLFLIPFYILALLKLIYNPEPLDRVAVFQIAFHTGLLFYWIGMLILDLKKYIERNSPGIRKVYQSPEVWTHFIKQASG